MQPVGAILSDPVGQRAILFLIAASGLWFWVPAESVLTWSAMCLLFEVCMCCFFCFLMCVAPVFDRYILSDIKDLLLALFKVIDGAIHAWRMLVLHFWETQTLKWRGTGDGLSEEEFEDMQPPN